MQQPPAWVAAAAAAAAATALQETSASAVIFASTAAARHEADLNDNEADDPTRALLSPAEHRSWSGDFPAARATALLTSRQARQFTDLCAAIRKGDYPLLQQRLLSLEQADLEVVCSAAPDGRPLLHILLSQSGDPACRDMLTLLLDTCPGAASAQDSEGRIALHIAARKADPDLLLPLLPLTAGRVDSLDHQGRSPLHHLAFQGPRDPANFQKCAEMLQAAGADWTLAAHDGYDAAGRCDTRCANILMGRPSYARNQLDILRERPEIGPEQIKAMDDEKMPTIRLDGIDDQREALGKSRLYVHHHERLRDRIAFQHELTEHVGAHITPRRRVLFDRLSDAIVADRIDDFTRLMASLPPAAVRSILTHRDDQRPPLLHALLKGKPGAHSADMLRILLQACPEAVKVVGDWGQAALHVAADTGAVWALGMLLAHTDPADINRRDRLDRYPLYMLAWNARHIDPADFQRGVRQLQDHGADWTLRVGSQDAAGVCARVPQACNLVLGLSPSSPQCLVEMQQMHPAPTAASLRAAQLAGMKITRKDLIDASRAARGLAPLYLRDHGNTEDRREFARKWLK